MGGWCIFEWVVFIWMGFISMGGLGVFVCIGVVFLLELFSQFLIVVTPR